MTQPRAPERAALAASAEEPQMSQPAPLKAMPLTASVNQPPRAHRCDARAGLVEYGQVGSAEVCKSRTARGGEDLDIVPLRRRPEFG